MPFLASGPRKYLSQFIFVAAISAITAEIGFLLLPQGSLIILALPPSAVGLAALFLYGYDLWPAYTLSIIGVSLLHNGNLPLDVGISVADTVEALLGAYFLRRYVQLRPMLARMRDSMGLLVACIAPSLVSAFGISALMYFAGSIDVKTWQSTFASIWIEHAVITLSFSPFLIRWLYRPVFYKTKDELIEGAIIFGSLSACSYFLFWTPYGSIGSISLLYVLLIPLLWAALRTGPRGTTLALALVAVISSSGIIFGSGPFSTQNNPQSIFLLQMLLGAIDVIFLIITSIFEERKEAVITLETNVVQLERALKKIRSEDQAKTNFLAILAHELRNPLAPIVTSAELLKTDPSGMADPALIDTIESHAHTISLLLDDLLDVSRITQNKFELRRERVLLSSAVQRSLESVKPFIDSRGHRLDVTLPEEELFLDGDPLRIEQILVNLLNNAGKYTDPGGRITLVCSREGTLAVLCVTDNGIGIETEKLAGVFEPFGQQGAVTRGPGGLGIGLSLTKQLAELHGGTVEAESRGLGHGSTFTVRLPLSAGLVTGSASTPRNFVNRLRARPSVQDFKTILIVDDNEPAAKGLATLLSRSGHTALIALTGKEALEKVASLKPDVVILDIGLPDMSGYEVVQKIRALPEHPRKLIALTGYGQDEDKSKSAEAGFDAHLTKPVSLADVEAVL